MNSFCEWKYYLDTLLSELKLLENSESFSNLRAFLTHNGLVSLILSTV